MRPIPSFLAVLLLAIPLANLAPLGGRTARAADPTINELVKAFQADLKSDDADVRARAYDRLHLARDPSIVDVIVKSLRDLKSQQTKIRREQDRIEAAYEKQFEKKLDADQAFESSSMSSRDMDHYNKKVSAITRKLDGLRLELKSLENDFTRTRALFDSAVTAVTKVLDNVPDGGPGGRAWRACGRAGSSRAIPRTACVGWTPSPTSIAPASPSSSAPPSPTWSATRRSGRPRSSRLVPARIRRRWTTRRRTSGRRPRGTCRRRPSTRWHFCTRRSASNR